MYLLDANTYIEAQNRYYNASFCPAYWDWIDHQFAKGNLNSVIPVYDELAGYGDDLSRWVRKRKHHFIDVSAEPVQEKFSEIVAYIATLKKPNANVAEFLGKADPWLIAQAAVTGATVVTHEVPVDPQSKKIKIPNVCQQFNVSHMNTFDLLKSLAVVFALKK
ncbi:MAG: DUF4411 family protein [Gammaproteobacteria bacterium]